MSDDKRKKPSESKDEKAAGWMVTYGDMVTLLLVFFVLLFSFSAIDTVQFRDLQTSMAGAMSVLSGGKMVVDPSEFPEYRVKRGGPDLRAMNDFLENLRVFVREQQMAEFADVVMNEQGIALSLSDLALFAPGSARLTAAGKRNLDKLFPLIDVFPNYVEVVGHTDLNPVKRGRFADNWSLSGARALSVVKYYTAKDPVLKKRFAATAYGANKPLTDEPDEQRMNRRVDIIFKRL